MDDAGLEVARAVDYPAIFAGKKPVRVSRAMVAAGREAFKGERKLLDDLWSAFDCDIDVAVTAIYRAMAKAAK